MNSRNDDEGAVLQLKSRTRPETVPSAAGDKVLGGLGELARATGELGINVGVSENAAALSSALCNTFEAVFLHLAVPFLIFHPHTEPGGLLAHSSGQNLEQIALPGTQGRHGRRGHPRAGLDVLPPSAGNQSLGEVHNVGGVGDLPA